MTYHQITSEERYTLALLRKQGQSMAEISRTMGRHPSSLYRELARNRCADGAYRQTKAQKRTNGRRRRSRRNARFGDAELMLVDRLIREEQWSPDQVSGELRRRGWLRISHETIYRYVWRDKAQGGLLYQHLRCSPKLKRKRYGSYESRGRLAGKRHISERPLTVEARQEIGHWEMDTVMGHGSKDCVITMVERVTGLVLIGKLADRTKEATTNRAIELIQSNRALFKTITADNGTEFHDYVRIEQVTGVMIYFATPYHSWERGTNENTNGLIRQYLPKRVSMHGLTQQRCGDIADKLNTRPRKRHDYLSPLERLNAA
jgi:IS30 family transposase